MTKITSSPAAAYLTSPNIVHPAGELPRDDADARIAAAEAAARTDIGSRLGVTVTGGSIERATLFYVPAAPAAPTLNAKTATTVTLDWVAVDTATGYKVYKGGVLVADVGNVVTYQVTGLTTATAYTFTLKAYNAVGDGTASAGLAVTTS